MLDVVAYICNYTYKFLDATLFMLDVQALGYSDTYLPPTCYVFCPRYILCVCNDNVHKLGEPEIVDNGVLKMDFICLAFTKKFKNGRVIWFFC